MDREPERGAPLLERDAELQAIDDALSSAALGAGSLTLVEGRAGTGKSRLLDTAAAAAADAGLDVLRARGEEPEREFAFGVVLGLLEGPVKRLAPRARREVVSDAALLAEPLLDGTLAAAPPSDRQTLFGLLHGLYWITQNLADQRPLALIVDDAQWGDVPSLRFLAYLSHRLDGLPVALVAARRTGDEAADPEPLRTLGAGPLARRLQTRPLSGAGVAQLVRSWCPQASGGFCDTCVEVTGGNPFFVRELINTVLAERIAPTDEGAAQIRGLAPDAISRTILLRLSRLPPAVTALAQAVAVLGEAPLADAAQLARLKPDEAVAATKALAGSGIIVDGAAISFAHPIVRAVVSADTAPSELGRLHRRAAGLLCTARAPAERISAHLLAAPPAREPWVIEPLRVAAAHALTSGAPDSAIRYLRRALDEPPTAADEAELLVELGQAEAAGARPEAPERFRAALALRTEPLWRARVQLILGRALSGQGRFQEAATAFELGAADARGRDPDLLADLEAGYVAVAWLEPGLYTAAAERIERLIRQKPGQDAPSLRPVLADVSLARAWGGAPAAEVRPLAERAWADGELLAEQGPDSHSIYVLSGALLAIDELDQELVVLDAALGEARRRGSVMAVATASYCRSIPLYFQARIPEAIADVEQAVRSERDGWEMFLPTARGFLALALLERGDVAQAERALELRDAERWRSSLPYTAYLHARAALRLAQRRPGEALDDATEMGRLLEGTFGGTGRGFLQWRCFAALAAAAVGQRERAVELCEQELEVARAGDRAREIGATLRTMAVLEQGERRIELLSEAVATLASSQSVLELLRAQVDLGAALRRAGRRRDARGPLERALDTASARGATALSERAREELLATGARPRRTALRGVESLTPSELRVARLAADGLMNREIAEALFVTPKTVDFHLRHIYQKLGVGRHELAGMLGSTKH